MSFSIILGQQLVCVEKTSGFAKQRRFTVGVSQDSLLAARFRPRGVNLRASRTQLLNGYTNQVDIFRSISPPLKVLTTDRERVLAFGAETSTITTKATTPQRTMT